MHVITCISHFGCTVLLSDSYRHKDRFFQDRIAKVKFLTYRKCKPNSVLKRPQWRVAVHVKVKWKSAKTNSIKLLWKTLLVWISAKERPSINPDRQGKIWLSNSKVTSWRCYLRTPSWWYHHFHFDIWRPFEHKWFPSSLCLVFNYGLAEYIHFTLVSFRVCLRS